VPRIKTIQAAFSGGEVSESFEGRIDLAVYQKSLIKARNVYIDNIGYAFRREGMRYIDNTDGDQQVRLSPFEFNTEQVYLFEFTPGKLRVFEDDVEIFSSTAAPLNDLTADIIQTMDITQSADTMLIVHEDLEPISITRTGAATFVTSTIQIQGVPQFTFPDTVGAGTNEVMKLRADWTGTASFAFILEGERSDTIQLDKGVSAATNAGRIQSSLRNLKITSNSGISVVAVNAEEFDITFGGQDGSKNWITPELIDRLGFDSVSIATITNGGEPTEDVWSNSRGWPRTITFFEGRLWFGGSKSRPQTLWASAISDFFNFNVGTGLDNQAIDVTIDDDQVNAINALISGRTLQVFTTGGEFAILKEFDDPVTPTSIVLRKQTLHGSKQVRPVSIDGGILFLEASGNVLREFVFNDLEQSFNAPNVSVLTPDIIRDAVRLAVRRSVADASVSYIYIVNTDGTVAVLNKLREQDLRAFTLFETQGQIEDVAVVGGEVYFSVARVIDGNNVRFIEKLDRNYFLDAAEQQEQVSATTNFTGFTHLANEDVTVLGALEPDELNGSLNDNTIDGAGEITVELPMKKLEVGLFFAAELETLPIEALLRGTTQTAGEWKRLVCANIRMQDSRNLLIKSGRGEYRPNFRQMDTQVLDNPIPLFTGWKKVYIGGVDRDVSITITQEEPLEFRVLMLAIDISLGG
jgi:hypothetical protein